MQDWISDRLWPFVRGDMRAEEFELWAYGPSELEVLLPNDLYLEVISVDYSNVASVFALRQRLAEYARRNSAAACECRTLPNLADVSMEQHDEVFRSLDRIAYRGEQYWWLSIDRCRECNQWWLVASESRINDVFLMRRQTDGAAKPIIERGMWPDEFDRFSILLELGRERGHRWRFVDPLSPGLVQTAIDLANEAPGLDTARLAYLLQIGEAHAEALASHAELESTVRFVRSGPPSTR